MMRAEDPPKVPRHVETILVAAATALVTTFATKLAERVIDRVWPVKKDEPK